MTLSLFTQKKTQKTASAEPSPQHRIPAQLQNPEFRFCLLGRWDAYRNGKPLGKAPFTSGWQKNGYRYDDEKLLSHPHNFGIVGGYGRLRVRDIDDVDLAAKMIAENKFDTFVVRTGSGGLHLYYLSDYDTNHVLANGELRAKNYQVVAPNCRHPSGNYYKVVADLPIKEVSIDEMKKIIAPYLKATDAAKDGNHELDVGIGNGGLKADGTVDRSAREFGEVCRMIKNGKTREQIFAEMMAFEKWSTAHPSYRDLTYEKAFASVESEKKTQEAARVFGREGQAQQFSGVQPFFYDRAGMWWLWSRDSCAWKICDDIDLLNMIRDALHIDTIRTGDRAEILQALKQQGRKMIPQEPPASWVQCGTKVYDVAAPNAAPFDATPKYLFCNPISLTPTDGSTPILDSLFASWVGQDKVSLLKETLSFCIVPHYIIQRIICCVGVGSNGKGTYFKLIEKIFGKENIASSNLDRLSESRFESARLFKKLVCTIAETSNVKLTDTSTLKMLSGGDQIPAEWKGKSPFTFENYAKIFILTNTLPETSDKTDGFYRRFLIIDFPNQFPESDILATVPEEEYSHLLYQLINITARLWQTRAFSGEGDISQRRESYEKHSDPAQQFIDAHLKREFGRHSLSTKVYNEFLAYCRLKGFNSFTFQQFRAALESKGVQFDRKRIEGTENPVSVLLDYCFVSTVSTVRGVPTQSLIRNGWNTPAQSAQSTQKRFDPSEVFE